MAASGQEPPVNTEQRLENAAESLEDESPKDDAFLQALEYYSRHPININTATAEDLLPLQLLTDLQIDNIIQYRRLLGNFISIYELQAVPTLDVQTLRNLKPYIYAGAASSAGETLRSRFRGGEQTVLTRLTRVLEKSRGYDPTLRSYYLGDPNHVMVRYRYQFKNLLQFGLMADKDAGEQFFKGAQRYGFDFYSAHFFVRNIGRVKSLALGDYLVNMGQGLIQWQSLGFGKSAEAMGIKRQSATLMPYRSAGEFYFNRGAAATFDLGRIQATAFVSSKKFSGNAITDTIDRFSSFQTSGYYRTPSEIADRYNLNDLSAGGSVAYQTGNLKVALNTVSHHFSLPLQKRTDVYNFFAPTGTEMWNSSVDYSYTHKNVHLFGEAAVDKAFHTAFVNGALISVDPRVDVSLFHRSIQPAYQAFYGNAFTENTLPSNEKGFYVGMNFRPAIGWRVAAYADFFKFPFLRYRVNAPTSGFEYLAQVNYNPDKLTEIYVRYRTKNKPLNISDNPAAVNFPEDNLRKNLRLQFSRQVSPVVSLRSRAEMMWMQKESTGTEAGFMMYVDGKYKPGFRFSANARLQYFETGGYDSRIYVFENDVLYSYSIPAFFDKGYRYYLNINYDFNNYLSGWVRFAQTIYPEKEVVGSGLDQISEGHKSEVKLQFLFRF
ncbi:MAG: ComEA family DNA-binding protein [Flavisolibacter sp.]